MILRRRYRDFDRDDASVPLPSTHAMPPKRRHRRRDDFSARPISPCIRPLISAAGHVDIARASALSQGIIARRSPPSRRACHDTSSPCGRRAQHAFCLSRWPFPERVPIPSRRPRFSSSTLTVTFTPIRAHAAATRNYAPCRFARPTGRRRLSKKADACHYSGAAQRHFDSCRCYFCKTQEYFPRYDIRPCRR